MRRFAVLMSLLGAAAVAASACQSTGEGRAGRVREPRPCQDVTVSVYFAPNAARLTADGRRVIAAAARQAQPCRVEAVSVLGLADAPGDPAANLELSRQRAAQVADAVQRAGLPAATFDVAAAGEAGALTADGARAPLRRRVDVTLKLARPQ